MAARKLTAKKTKNFPSPEQVRDAAFAVIAAKGYGKLRISDLADQFDVPFQDFYNVYPSTEIIIDGFLDLIDQAMIKNITPESASNKRELYFDMMMARMDMLQEYRPGAVKWLQEALKHPLTVAHLLKRWNKSLSLMLDIAKDSPVFPVKKVGLAAIYLYTLHAWIKDDSADMAKTMAALDQGLGRAEEFVETFMTPKKKS